jgi:hypothetical protein
MSVFRWASFRRLLPLPFLILAFFGTTWNVFEDGSGDAPTILAAADSALAGDTVLVWPGEYESAPGIDLPGDVHLVAQGGPTATSIICDASRGLYSLYVDASVANTFISGFSFTGSGPGYGSYGIVTVEGNHEVRNCVFEELAVNRAGTPLSIGGPGVVRDCEFRHNENGVPWGTPYQCLGVAASGSVLIENCRFVANSISSALGVSAAGSVTVRDCQFLDLFGGSSIRAGWGSVVLEGCLFEGGVSGTCVRAVSDGSLELRGNTFVGNDMTVVVTEDGNPSLVIENNVLAQNTAATNFETGTFAIACNVLWQNGVDWQGIDDQTGLNGNVVADPMFCDSEGHVYTVSVNSPCLPENSNGCGLIGASGRTTPGTQH